MVRGSVYLAFFSVYSKAFKEHHTMLSDMVPCRLTFTDSAGDQPVPVHAPEHIGGVQVSGSSRFWDTENIAFSGIRPQHGPDSSESLYLLRYPGPPPQPPAAATIVVI